MAESDIFNPTDWVAAGLDFNPNPSYGFDVTPADNRQVQTPRFGAPYSRDAANAGHTFTLQWIGIPLSIVQRLRQFFHAFKNGYFTLIDVDAGGRHYVGRFKSAPKVSHPYNGKYNVQGLIFEERPLARMLEYPSDFNADGHQLNVVDDDLNPLVALMQGTWSVGLPPVPNVTAVNPTVPSAFVGYSLAAVMGDWAQTAYVGWGFRLTMQVNPLVALFNIFLDGEQIVTGVDLAGLVVTAKDDRVMAFAVNSLTGGPSALVITITPVPLDVHRVKIVVAGQNAQGGNQGFFPPIEYIY